MLDSELVAKLEELNEKLTFITDAVNESKITSSYVLKLNETLQEVKRDQKSILAEVNKKLEDLKDELLFFNYQ